MAEPRDLSRLPALFAVLGVLLLSAAFFALAREVMKLQDVRSREAQRELVEADYQVLLARFQVFLERAWPSWDGAGASGLIDQGFRVRTDGAFLVPSLVRFVPEPPLTSEVRSWLTEVTNEATDLALDGRERDAYERLLEAKKKCPDPACRGELSYRAARLAQSFYPAAMARELLQQVAQEHPGAVGLADYPLAFLARVQLALLFREMRVREAERATLLDLLRDVAAGAWEMDSFTEELCFQMVQKMLGEEPPKELEKTRRLVTLGRKVLLPRVDMEGWNELASREGGGSAVSPVRWLAARVRGIPILAGYQAFREQETQGIQGVTLSLEKVQAELAGAAAGLLELGGGFLLHGSEEGLVLARGGPIEGPGVRLERALPIAGTGAFLAVYRPVPVLEWPERILPWAGFALILIALGGGTLLAIRALHHEVNLARLRREFVDTVSHELRTPLTSIRLNADLLGRAGLAEERRSVALAHIQEEAYRLERMVSDILDLSRFRRSGSSWMHPQAVGPEEIVDAALRSHLPGLEARGFRVDLRIPEGLPRVLADLDAAARALGNLLGNAGKYSGMAREIELVLGMAGGRVAFAVVDHGPGVPPGERDRIFRRFYRSPATAGEAVGVGLGLSVAREIARGLGGEIRVEATPGGGATFVLELPRVEGDSLAAVHGGAARGSG